MKMDIYSILQFKNQIKIIKNESHNSVKLKSQENVFFCSYLFFYEKDRHITLFEKWSFFSCNRFT